MKKTLVRSLAMAFAGSLLMAGSAMAVPTTLSMQLDDLLTAGVDATIIDNGVGDLNPALGVILYSGAFGAWTLNVSTGQSPVTGSLYLPHMDLNSVNTTGGAGDLKITLSESAPNWSYPGMNFLTSAVGGTVNTLDSSATAQFETFVNGSSIGLLGPFGTGGFTGTQMMYTLPAGAVDMVAILHHTQAGSSSFNWDLKANPVPEPATMLLLGTGLVGLAGARRRKANKKA